VDAGATGPFATGLSPSGSARGLTRSWPGGRVARPANEEEKMAIERAPEIEAFLREAGAAHQRGDASL
jgi:hypothetical protein